jgi:uncharacterized protein YdaU (DUF1376 family)
VADEKATAPPYFGFYPRDFMDGVMHLSAELRGCYISLLCFEWTAKSVPGDDPAQLRNIMGVASNAAATKAWAVLQGKFERQPDGRWLNARLERERTKVDAFFESQRAKAALGGRPKKNDAPNPEGNPGKNPGKNPGVKPGQSPGRTHPDPDTEPRSGSNTVQGSKITSGSGDLPKHLRTETRTPSDALATAFVQGHEIWTKVLNWVDALPETEISQHGRRFFRDVYAAAVVNGRLELVFEQAVVAQTFLRDYRRITATALDAVGHPGFDLRAVARPKPKAAKAS